jgi:hypothetical protein
LSQPPAVAVAVSVAIPVLQKPEESPSSITSSVPVTKELSSEATVTAEKTDAVALAPSLPLKPETVVERADSLEEKVNGATRVVVSNACRVAVEEKKTEHVAAVAKPVLTLDEKRRLYVERKKQVIVEKLADWKKDFKPYPAAFLYTSASIVDNVTNAVTGLFGGQKIQTKEAVVKEAERMSASMIASFEKKLYEATTIADLKNVLTKNLAALNSNRPFVDTPTEVKLKEGAALMQEQLAALEPSKSVRTNANT